MIWKSAHKLAHPVPRLDKTQVRGLSEDQRKEHCALKNQGEVSS